jgi:hypothetical protein
MEKAPQCCRDHRLMPNLSTEFGRTFRILLAVEWSIAA